MKYFAQSIGYICVACVIMFAFRCCRDVALSGQETAKARVQMEK